MKEENKLDEITRQRMKLAGLAVPNDVSDEEQAWNKAVNREVRVRETAGELIKTMPVAEAFAKAEEFVDLAIARFDAVYDKKPRTMS